MILPQSLQERLDRESYVSCLIDLTRTLCCEPKPMVENFTTVTHSVCIVLDEWASGGRDTAPYKEEVEWVYPFYKFTQSMRHIPSDKDGAGNEREYVIGGAEKKGIDDAMWDLYRDLEKISFQFKLRLTDARDPHVPLKRYGVKADCDLPWWWKPIFDCKEDGEGRLIQEIRKGVVGFSTVDLDDILHSFEMLAKLKAPQGSELRQEYDKFERELVMAKEDGTCAARDSKADSSESVAIQGVEPKSTVKDTEWTKLLEEIAEDARNPMVRADICVRWEDVKREIGTRQTAEMKRENFTDVLNWVNKFRNPGDPIEWTWQAAEKWAKRHPDTIKKLRENPNL